MPHFIDFFLSGIDVGAHGAQGSAQQVVLLLYGGFLVLEFLDVVQCALVLFDVMARVEGSVPILDQRLLRLVLLGAGACHFLVEQFVIQGNVFLYPGLAVEPLDHGNGSLQHCVHGLVLGIKLPHFFDDFGLLLLIEQDDVLHLAAQDFAAVALLLVDLIDFLAQLGVDPGARHLLQQVGFFVVIAVEELGKHALCEHYGTEKLVDVKPDDILDFFIDFIRVADEGRRCDPVGGAQDSGNR